MSELTGKLKDLYHEKMDAMHEKVDHMQADRKEKKAKEQKEKEKENSSVLWTVAKYGLLFFGVRKLYRRLAV